MILQSIAPEARSSATDYVADVRDARETEVRQCPMPNIQCLMPDAPAFQKKMREQSTIADCPRLPIL
ncbi:hypothetical protein QUA32_07605 [Microcoleus sp. Pol14D6]|jgi:hypothetical protein|uniref:hypothetical protein n=1 Tax=unclassified Microcoleus TaxID=2642155 RepID=UPI002FD77D9C